MDLTMKKPLMKPFKLDNKNTSVEYALATQYHLSLSLELLRGCQFSCKGCHVEKFGANELTDTDISNLHIWIDSMTKEGNYLPTIVFIAPTDFLASLNTEQVLSDPRVVSVLSKFRRLSLQTTYLDITRAPGIIEILHKHYSHMELELNFIIEPEQANKEKYINTIKNNREKMLEMLNWKNPVVSFCIINVYEFERIKKQDIQELLNDYRAFHDKIKDTFNTTLDFNFSMSRNKSWMSSHDIEEDIQRVSRIFDHGVDHEFNQTIRFSFGKLTDSLIEKHYNWLNGEWYISPLLYERCVSFAPELKIPLKSYNVRETEDFEANLIVEQYETASQKTECASCRYLGTCVDRSILKMMDVYGIKNCIIARKALDAINVVSI